MNSVILQFLFGTACIGIGFFAGLSLGWREYSLGDRHFAAPTVPHTDRQHAYVLIVIAALSLASTVYAGVQTARQAECNTDFKQSLVDRSAISTENQRHLDDMMSTVAVSVSNPQPDSREKARQAILDYQKWVEKAAEQRAANPIGDPHCGD